MAELMRCNLEHRMISDVPNGSKMEEGEEPHTVRSTCSIEQRVHLGFQPLDVRRLNRVLVLMMGLGPLILD